ncbi:hypothetical protein [Flavobacterium phycosphaerae]|uniref:hypothetical protein n=1 Tax=Flavobacterium phycosphaerae TaxID=2697515 RepID=UPI0013894D1F|nr:hypothetical protein [Flavobacterium phycosphaerae]
MEEFRGLVLYNLELDGNLNGVYTNNHPDLRGQIFTETARLRDDTIIVDETQIRVYDCFYFDAVDGSINCTLTFNITNRIITATWTLNGRVIFTGEGFQMNDRQIAISYWHADN